MLTNILLAANISVSPYATPSVTPQPTPAEVKDIIHTVTKDKFTFYLILAMAIVMIVIVSILVIQDHNEKKLWKNKPVYKNRQRLSDRYFLLIFQFLNEFLLTRDYIEKLSYRYRLISPLDKKLIARKTVITCLLSWGLSAITFILVFLLNPRLITLITVGVAIYLINTETVGRMAKNLEINLLIEIQRLIANVEHNYFVQYRVDDALYRSIDGLGPNMKIAANQIYALLLADDKEKALRDYYENIPNKYLRTFVSLSVGVMERGDQELNGKLLFIRNMENLQRIIDIELDKLQRLRMEFLGVIFVVIAPIFCVDFVKMFAINIKENMYSFFYGQTGFLCDLALLASIMSIYFIMRKSAEYKSFYQSRHRWLKNIDKIPIVKKAINNYCDKNASKVERLKRELRNNGSNIQVRHYIIRSILLAGIVFVISISTSCYLHKMTQKQLLNVSIADVENLTSAAKDKQYKPMRDLIEKYSKKFITKNVEIPSEEKMIKILQKNGAFNNEVINEALAKEILRRVNSYKKEHFSLLDLTISILLGITAYYIPDLVMKYNSTVSKDTMEDEVNQFNALIFMLMYVDGMTVKQILEELESFAVVYKQSIRICLNDYGLGDMKALFDLKDREPYEPFKRLVDNLIRCDDMPIYQAFHEIDLEQDGYMSKRKRANEESIKKRVTRAYLLASLPFLLLFAYGIVPTLLSSLNEINAMMKDLNDSSW